MYRQFRGENVNGGSLLGDIAVDGRLIFQWILKQYGVEVSGFIWLMTG